ncbi:MAG: hypothetical protein A3F63_16560 [Pseudomonadales bacterium RIFCSPHIGHO2_12_FULL_40_16]|nr:MAG: hypothetical protein A2W44_03920 [Acinetobacter sp. RIFCSPHIGHO2_12_41_5]OHC24192.1 MAG: hypothetical protein A3F63_16560 [Pseudomonadales bacterium RIFCSPHIGHO2_12_FULL_40_16]
MNKNNIIYVVSFFSGFLSLAQEILWMRMISFAGMSVPQTFSFTLALFLIGIATGAHIGKKLCQKRTHIRLNFLGQVFLLATCVDLVLLLGIYLFAKYINLSILLLGGFVFICAMVRGIVFPVVHHVGTHYIKTGSQISNVYFCNVIGSALAPLLISFIALNFLNTQQVYLLVCSLTSVVGLLCLEQTRYKIVVVGFTLLLASAITQPEKIYYELSKNSYRENLYPINILENKHGIIQIYDDHNDQVVFGANVYDGKLNTNLFHNTNGIDRAYLLTVLKPDTENILVIGLSTGSWVKVLSMMPNIKKITVIEINPAYAQLIQSDPIVSDILKDDRIEIIFDDGRKWVKKHQEKQFDLVLMNTTWHWRAYVSNLLSQDFITLVKNTVKDDGYIFYNSTQSADAFYTAKQVLPYVYQYKFMVLASKNPIQLPNKNIIIKRLCLLKRHSNKKIIFKNHFECTRAADLIYSIPLVPYEKIDFQKFSSHLPTVITDDNMITEYKYGKGL